MTTGEPTAQGAARLPADRSVGYEGDDRKARILELLRVMAEAMEAMQDEYAAHVGLHRTDLEAVTHLHESVEPMTMRDLSERLHLTAGAVTGLVDRLERAGHVTRMPDPVDRRRTRLQLNAGARALTYRFFFELADRALQVLGTYDDDELAVIERFLTQLPGVLDPEGRHRMPTAAIERAAAGDDQLATGRGG